ncbi:MAG TPA: hypothetical protein VJ065_01660, partial [Patescibacteria group bacterium]|nr:hypothetical protein [Patescibacteria group bacterium]
MPFFKTRDQKPEPRNSSILNANNEGRKLESPETLLPLEKLIALAKKNGVNFGSGNPQERIRYFIKMGLLPHALRKAKRGKNNKTLTQPVSHLPYWTVERLIQIHELTEKGLTFRKIAKNFANSQKRQDSKAKRSILEASDAADFQKPIVKEVKSINILPRFGVSEKQISKKFKEHEVKVRNIVEEELRLAVTKPAFTASPNRFLQAARIFLLLTIIAGLSTAVFYTGSKLTKDQQKAKETAKETAKSFGTLGQVLAASSERHKLYIDADTEVSGTTLFLEDITAPNIVYSVSGGTGIAVTGGQRPIVSLDETEIVTSVNDLAGDVLLKGSGAISLSKSGQDITISSTGLTSEADTLATVTGRGATTSTLVNLDGGIAVDTSNFTVSGTTGDVVTAGDLAING